MDDKKPVWAASFILFLGLLSWPASRRINLEVELESARAEAEVRGHRLDTLKRRITALQTAFAGKPISGKTHAELFDFASKAEKAGDKVKAKALGDEGNLKSSMEELALGQPKFDRAHADLEKLEKKDQPYTPVLWLVSLGFFIFFFCVFRQSYAALFSVDKAAARHKLWAVWPLFLALLPGAGAVLSYWRKDIDSSAADWLAVSGAAAVLAALFLPRRLNAKGDAKACGEARALNARRARWGLLSVLWRVLGSRAVIVNGNRAELAINKLLSHAAKIALTVAAGYSLLGLTIGNMPRAMHCFGEYGALALILLATAAVAGVVILRARRCRASCPTKFPCPQCGKEMDTSDGLAGFMGQFFELRACHSCGTVTNSKGEKAALPAVAVGGPWRWAAAATLACALGGFVAAGMLWDAIGAHRLAELRGQAENAGYMTQVPKGRPKPRDEDNAAYYYEKAGKEYMDAKKETSFFKGKSEAEFSTLFLAQAIRGNTGSEEIAAARKLIEKRRDLLAQLELGSTKKEDHWGIDWDIRPTFKINIPKYGGVLTLSRLLACRAILASMDGRTAAALSDVQLGLKLARSVGAEPMLIARMVEFVLSGNAMDAASVVARRTSLLQASEALSPLLSDTQLLQHFKDSLTLEQFGMTDWFAEMTWPGALRVDDESGMGEVWIYWPFLKLDLASYAEYSLAVNRALAEPYSQGREAVNKTYEDLQRSGWMFAQMAASPSWRNYQAKAYVQAAKQRLALTAFSVRSFKDKNGRWPDALWEITPSPKTPRMLEDPFTGGFFKILKMKEGLVVYSVGPDEVDDQGAAYEATEMKGDVGWRI